MRTDRGANSVRLARLSEIDFKRRDWIEHSGWPIRQDDLARYFDKAQHVFQLGPGGYNPQEWEDANAVRLPLPEDEVETAVFQFGSGQTFTDLYRRQLERSLNVRVYYHATALELETDDAASQVTAVRAASRPGRAFRVRAKWVVLTGGGMTCAQLLLLSDRVRPEGLGNRHDLVGRYYMDHPLLQGGHFIPHSRGLFEAMVLYDLRTVRGVPVMGHLQIADAALERDGLFQLSMMMFPREPDYLARRELNARQARGFKSAKRILEGLKRGAPPTLQDLRLAIQGADGVGKRAYQRFFSRSSSLSHGGWSKGLNGNHNFGLFEVIHQAEQPPRRDNRIYLGEARDAFGSRKIVVDWRWHEQDMANTMRAQDLYARTLERAELGRYEILRPEGRPEVLSHSTAHYMGLTRMHDDPRQGVVDANCRVHGVRNLYIASSSVFTTGGFANPTLTTVALALRVGDWICAEAKAPPVSAARVLEPVH